MDSNLKEYLYRELMSILMLLEDRNVSSAQSDLESLIKKIQYNQL